MLSNRKRWMYGLASGGLLLAAGCDLSALTDQIADFKRGVEERAAEAQREFQKELDENGGEVNTYNGAVSVPEGAIEGSAEVKVADTDTSALSAPLPSVLTPVSHPVSFTPHGTTFKAPVTLTLFYAKSGGQNLSVVRLDDENDTSWERVDEEDVVIDSGSAMVRTTHFSVYAVVSCDDLGQFAGVCEEFKNGEISFADLVKKAPPKEDTWGGVDDGGTQPRPDAECAGVEDCVSLAMKCAQDPKAAECSGLQACGELLVKCGGELPGEACAEIRAECDRGVEPACQAFAELCDGDTQPNPGSRCEQLVADCARGDERACAAQKAECSGGPVPDGGVVDPGPGEDCERLSMACALQNDREACARFDAECTGGPVPACEQAAKDCKAGDRGACEYERQFCRGDAGVEEPPPPPPECEELARACGPNPEANTDACARFRETCGPGGEEPPPEDFCRTLDEMCRGGDEGACDIFKQQCVPPSEDGGVAPPPGPSPEQCERMYQECKAHPGTPVCTDHEALCV